MRFNRNSSAFLPFCVMLAFAICASAPVAADAQDDVNDLLNLDAAPAAKSEEKAKPAEKAEEKSAEAEVAKDEKPAEDAPKAAEKAEEEKPAEAEVAKDEKPAEDAPKAAEKAAEEKPAEAEVAKDEKPAEKASKAAEPTEDEKLVSEIAATEALVRESLKMQSEKELAAARAAMAAHDWKEAFAQYKLANAHVTDRADQVDVKRECQTGMAEAKYQEAKQALKENNRDHAKACAEEAQALQHPRAGALLDAIVAEKELEVASDFSEIKHRRNDEDYKKSRDVVRQRIRLASQYLAVADLDNALEQVDLVLRSDAYNEEAIKLRTRIQRKREMIIDKEREAQRRGMIADVNAAWRPVYAVNSAELKNVDGGTSKTPVGADAVRSAEQSIEKRMKDMMLPAISFRPPATIIDAVDFFRQASKDFDRPEIPVDQRGFNFVLQLDKALTSGGAAAPAGDGKDADGGFAADDAGGDEAAPGDVPVIPNVNASNISLHEALKLVCQVCKPAYKFKVQGSVVMVMPKTMTTDELVTRTYSVVESFVDRMNDASSSLANAKTGEFGGGGEGDGDGENPENQWKAYFEDLGVSWPQNSKIKYIKAVGKLRVTNTEDQLAILEDALNELNVTPSMIEIETRFVEVAQEDLNSLGFEWLLNSDYSFNVGGKLKKALNLKDGQFGSYDKVVNGGVLSEKTEVSAGGSYSSETTYGQTTETVYGWGRGDPIYATTKDPTTGETITTDRIVGYKKTGKNVGINAIDGSTYQTGMRYLSTEGNHISGDGNSSNDQFMRVNAFLGNADLSMILHMLSQRSDTDLLSAPKVVTKSGQEATIKVVTIYRYPQDYDVTIQSTSSGSTSSVSGSTTGGSDGKILPMVEPQNFETQEVGVILTVTPELSPEGFINLQLLPKVISEPTWKDYGMRVPMSSVMSSTAQTLAMASGNEDMQWFNVPMEQPFFKERSIDTHVTLYNGSTIVMGGLITEERKSMEDKIPFLGDIPFLGRFFRSRSEWSNKRNLLLFVTARLVDPNGRQIVQNASSDAEKKDAGVTPAPAAN